MDQQDRDEFVAAMRREDRSVVAYDDALFLAMSTAGRVGDRCRFFGRVGGGTFYADEDPEHTRWFPATTPVEAAGCLAVEFGEEFAEGLDWTQGGQGCSC
jgi:hypothetical protein